MSLNETVCVKLQNAKPLFLYYTFESQYEVTHKELIKIILASLSSLSCLGYLFMFATIYFNPKLQVHPMRLFMWLSFFGFCIFWLYLIKTTIICKTDKLLNDTLFTSIEQGNILYEASFQFQGLFLYLTFLILNVCVCYDLY